MTRIGRSEDYVEYCRETALHLRDIQDLALRGKNKTDVTRRIQERILQIIDLSPQDDMVDIGCGDGTLLRMALRNGVHTALGLLATEQEAAVVRRLGLEVRQGFTDRLPLADESASVVVCNSVLLMVPREKVFPSLREMYRIAKPAARVFIGEIPLGPGPPPEPEFESATDTLAYLYRQHGLRACLGMLRRMMYWTLTGQPMIIRGGSTISFYAQPEEFIAMGEAAGLRIVRSWPHEDWPPNRYNYLFRKDGASKPTAS